MWSHRAASLPPRRSHQDTRWAANADRIVFVSLPSCLQSCNDPAKGTHSTPTLPLFSAEIVAAAVHFSVFLGVRSSLTILRFRGSELLCRQIWPCCGNALVGQLKLSFRSISADQTSSVSDSCSSGTDHTAEQSKRYCNSRRVSTPQQCFQSKPE